MDAWIKGASYEALADMEVHGSKNNKLKARQEIDRRYGEEAIAVGKEANKIAAQPDLWARWLAGIAICVSIASLCLSMWGS